MESIYLKTFIMVAQTGSFTKAAETLFVTQSAVSRRIQFMENQYNCTLLDRTGPILKPTPAGDVLLEKAQKILEIEKELQSDLSPINNKQQLSFACTPTFGTRYLPEIMCKFIKNQPQVTNIKFSFDNPNAILKNLEIGAYETAVVEHCACFDCGDYKKIDLLGDEMVFAISKGANAINSLSSVEKILNYTLLSRKEGCCSRTLLDANLQKTGHTSKDFRKVIEINDLNVLIHALLNGDGIAFISRDLIKSYIDCNRLHQFKIKDFIVERKRTLLLPVQKSKCGLSESFANLIVARLGKAPIDVIKSVA